MNDEFTNETVAAIQQIFAMSVRKQLLVLTDTISAALVADPLHSACTVSGY